MAQSAGAFYTFYPPRPRRVHEVCAAAAPSFVLSLLALEQGHVIWLKSPQYKWINYSQICGSLPPSRLCYIHAPDAKTRNWCMEEALRSGAVGLVICECDKPLDFTAMRRLQLAAEKGGTTGVLLIPEHHQSPVSETRWRCVPLHDPDDENEHSALQHWQLVKNKSGPPASWKVNWNAKTHRIFVV